jgi:uncharacterized protein (DUF433 family)
MPSGNEFWTATEAAAVTGVPVKSVYKTVAERLPRASLVRRSGQTYLKPVALTCVRLDYELPKEVPAEVRRFVYRQVATGAAGRVEVRGSKLFSYVVDAGPAASLVAGRLRRYVRAMKWIVESPDVQAGAATFRGTRLLVHPIADLLQAGCGEDELREDYPNLTSAMMEAARVFAEAHPRRGRPRQPAWRKSSPLPGD